MLGQDGILNDSSTHYWHLSSDALKLCLISTSVGQGWSVYCVLLRWFSIQTPLDSFSFSLCGSFLTVGCSSWMIWKINCRLPIQLATSGRLSVQNNQVFRYLSLYRLISGHVLASTFWGASLVMYNHNEEYLVSLALPATSFLLTENSTTFLGSQNCLQLSPGLTWTSVSSCLVALKHRCCFTPSSSSILQPFVARLLQPALFMCPTLLTFIYNIAISLLSQVRTLALSSLSTCFSSLFILCPFFLCLSLLTSILFLLGGHYWLCFIC